MKINKICIIQKEIIEIDQESEDINKLGHLFEFQMLKTLKVLC